MSKTHWKNLTDSKFLGSYSFGDTIKEIILTIKIIQKEEVTNSMGQSENCVVVYFEEENVNGVEIKPMIFNKTNLERMEKLFGTPFIEDWIGKRIYIMKTMTDVAGDKKDCLRVKLDLPPFKAKTVESVHNCIVCGKNISEKVYNAAMEKFGVAVCSKECAEKAVELVKEKEGENN